LPGRVMNYFSRFCSVSFWRFYFSATHLRVGLD
jgi:hypothetical protein